MTAPIISMDLESLVWPESPADFLRRHWSRRTFVHHGGPTRLAGIAAMLADFDVRRLLLATASPVQVWMPPGQEPRVKLVDGRKAVELHRQGRTVYFDLHDAIPECRRWLDALGADLGIPWSGRKLSVFASRPGNVTPLHFDRNENFTLHVRGAKRWKIAPNHDIPAPVDNYFAGHSASAEMQLYMPAVSSAPADLETVEMRPGSLMYLPAGTWHGTETGEDSVQLNFAFVLPAAFEIVLHALRATLVRGAAWRAPVPPLRSREDHAAFEQQVAALLAELPGLASHLHAGSIAPAPAFREDVDLAVGVAAGLCTFPIDSATPLRWSETATRSRTTQSGAPTLDVTFHLGPASRSCRLRLSAEALGAAEWLTTREGVFTLGSAPPSAAPQLATIAAALAAAGALHVST